MKVDKVVLPKKEPVTPVVDNIRGASQPEVAVAQPEAPVAPKKVEVKKEEAGLSARQIEAREKAAKEAIAKPKEVDAPESVVDPSGEFVTLTAADPKVVLEASINGEFWKGKSITVPKQFEGDVRRLLEVAGMYVKN